MDINYGIVATSGDAREVAQRVAGDTAGVAAAGAVAGAAVAIGCGATLCTVALPVVAGLATASVVSDVVGDVWDAFFG